MRPFIENKCMFSAGIRAGHPVLAGRRNRNRDRSWSVVVGRGWSGQDAYVILNRQDSSVSLIDRAGI